MKLMLDTSVFLRRLNDNTIPRSLERLLMKQSTEIVVSIVTGWEIVLKPKLKYSATDVEAAVQEMGAVLLPIKFKHLNEFSNLPFHEDHKDPFDRMLIAQALAEDLSIAS